MVETKNNIRLEVTAGDTVAWNVKLNNITENLRLAYFTVKENPDDDAVIQKTLNAGITLVDNRAYRDQKTYKIQLQSEDTAGLSPDLQYMYDLKVAIGNVVKTIISGVFVVRESVTSPTLIIVDDAEVQAVDLLSAEFETTEATDGIEYEQDPVANAKIGDMTTLNTTQKSTLVGAINEVNTKASNTKEDVDKILDGTLLVPNATNATTAENAEKTDFSNGEWIECRASAGYTVTTAGVYQVGSLGLTGNDEAVVGSTGIMYCDPAYPQRGGCVVFQGYSVVTDEVQIITKQAEFIDGKIKLLGRDITILLSSGTALSNESNYDFFVRKIR